MLQNQIINLCLKKEVIHKKWILFKIESGNDQMQHSKDTETQSF